MPARLASVERLDHPLYRPDFPVGPGVPTEAGWAKAIWGFGERHTTIHTNGNAQGSALLEAREHRRPRCEHTFAQSLGPRADRPYLRSESHTIGDEIERHDGPMAIKRTAGCEEPAEQCKTASPSKGMIPPPPGFDTSTYRSFRAAASGRRRSERSR